MQRVRPQDIWNYHNDFDTLLNAVMSILNIFYYSLIITCAFCVNYKVGGRGGLISARKSWGWRMNNTLILKFHALRVLKFQAWRFYLHIIVASFDLITSSWKKEDRSMTRNFAYMSNNMPLLSCEYMELKCIWTLPGNIQQGFKVCWHMVQTDDFRVVLMASKQVLEQTLSYGN